MAAENDAADSVQREQGRSTALGATRHSTGSGASSVMSDLGGALLAGTGASPTAPAAGRLAGRVGSVAFETALSIKRAIPAEGTLPVESSPPPSQAALTATSRVSGVTGLVADGAGLLLAAVTAASFQALVSARSSGGDVDRLFTTEMGRLSFAIPLLLIVLSGSRRPSHMHLETTAAQQVRELAMPLAAGGSGFIALWSVFHAAGIDQPGLDGVLLMCVVALGSVTATRVVYHAPPRRDGRRARRVLIVGSGVVASRVEMQLSSVEGVEVVGFVDDDPMDPRGCLGPLSDLSEISRYHDVDHVVVAFTRSANERVMDALRPVQGRLPITVVPRFFEVLPASGRVHDLGSGLPAISVGPCALGWVPRVVKRTMDVTGALCVLVISSPLLAAVAVAIAVTSRGPVIFRQTRIGRDGLEFDMLKFRSMVAEREARHPSHGESVTGPFPKLKHDPRVTRVGRFIRRASIDELPQLLNVLRGDMALVGPRPFVPEDAAWIGGWATRRYSVRPGITGLWQVSGRNDLTFEEMCRLDHIYVSSWSVGLDVRILARTLRAVVAGDGAY